MTKQEKTNGTARIHTYKSDEADLSRRIQHKFLGLRKAIARREIEPVCLAYLALREATAWDDAKLAEMFKQADKIISHSAADVIVSAFSHRHCFMCQNGTIPCDDCGESGFAKGGGKCPICDGVGSISCDFCQGTGWVARNTIPSEIIEDILRRHIANVKKDLKDLKLLIGKFNATNVKDVPVELRRSLRKWAMRLCARMKNLAGEELVGGREKKRLLATTSQLDSFLKTLQNA